MKLFKKISNKEAVLMAADHIEAHPESFVFSKVFIPKTIKDDGCALGWIGFFLNKNRFFKKVRFDDVAKDFKVASFVIIYERIRIGCGNHNWYRDPGLCVKGLRAYAETL